MSYTALHRLAYIGHIPLPQLHADLLCTASRKLVFDMFWTRLECGWFDIQGGLKSKPLPNYQKLC